MTTVVIQNTQSFGTLSNNIVSQLFFINANLARLSAALGNASSGFTGTAGTEYEGPETLFAVVPDATTPGQQGSAYASAITTIAQNWATFWAAAQGAIDTLDNGFRFS